MISVPQSTFYMRIMEPTQPPPVEVVGAILVSTLLLLDEGQDDPHGGKSYHSGENTKPRARMNPHIAGDHASRKAVEDERPERVIGLLPRLCSSLPAESKNRKKIER